MKVLVLLALGLCLSEVNTLIHSRAMRLRHGQFKLSFPSSSTSSSPGISARTQLRATTESPPEAPEANVELEPHLPDEKLLRTCALLIAMWDEISFPPEEDTFTDFKLSDFGLNRLDVKGFISHFQNCKDYAAERAFLIATQDDDGNDILRLQNVNFRMLIEEDDDQWGQFDRSLLGEDHNVPQKTIFPVEDDDDIVMEDTREWVGRVIADFGVCPFTIDPDRAGIPMGGVRYRVSRAKEADEAFLRFWEEVAGKSAMRYIYCN
jgi:hypothetical protein